MIKNFVVALLTIFVWMPAVQAQGLQSKATQQFDPFPSTNKIEYARAVELAKKGDASAFYWLSYYFAKGEGVDQNPEAAWRFLAKANESGCSQVSYLLARFNEQEALGNEIIERYKSGCDKREVHELLEDSELQYFMSEYDFGWKGFAASNFKRGIQCYKNKIAAEYVISLYERAVRGGLSLATNDIERVKRKLRKNDVVRQDEIIARDEKTRTAREALSILEGEDNAKKLQLAEERAKIREAGELWCSWPDKLGGDATRKIAEQAAKKFNCTFYGDFSYGALSDWGVSFTNSWKRGCGGSLIAEKQIWSGRAVEKFDSEGRLVWICSMDGLTEDAEELNWISAERKTALEACQLKWAKEHGMTFDEAKAKYAKWKEEHSVGRPLGGLRRPGMFGGGLLRARRLQRQQESGSQAK